MATITRRGPHKYQAEIRIKGYPRQTHTFPTREEAEMWAQEQELAMRKGGWVCRKEGETTTLGEALERYRTEITATKKSARREGQRIDYLQREPIAARPLVALHGGDLARWRDSKLQTLSPASVRLYLALISHLYTIARKEWAMPYLDNPVQAIRLPAGSQERDRRLAWGEEDLLLKAAADLHHDLPAFIILAIETGMRRGELLGCRWEWLRGNAIYLPDTKNGKARAVPLSSRARETLTKMPRRLDGKLFNISPDWGTRAFQQACKLAGIEGLRLHDLRHEATSRFFERGLNVMEVAAITGHRSLSMLRRYTQLRPDDLAKKLG